MTKKEQRLQEWKTRIADYRASGLTMAAWCQAHQFSKETLKYWLRKTNANPAASQGHPPRFVPLTVSHSSVSSALFVEIGQAKIEVRAGFDAELLRAVVQALEIPSC
ncbi:IS66 family insertion sequence element accessory protein TnpA [Paenibacillus sp. FA6]|uniref:IS66 family insertion sequence element accessory protein TnpA n=1 Tax=Paenibacillus sp. FA6 TaxID=3413029 RepID=UPI003F65E253